MLFSDSEILTCLLKSATLAYNSDNLDLFKIYTDSVLAFVA